MHQMCNIKICCRLRPTHAFTFIFRFNNIHSSFKHHLKSICSDIVPVFEMIKRSKIIKKVPFKIKNIYAKETKNVFDKIIKNWL